MSDTAVDTPAADPAPPATGDQPAPAADTNPEPADLGDAGKRAIDRMKAERDEARKEAKKHADALQQIEDAKKSEIERVNDRAAKETKRADDAVAELTRLRVAMRHGISEEDFDLLGTGTEEEIDARAQRLAAKNKAAADAAATPDPLAPRRPVEQLRPGATPTDPQPADDAYPAHWLPASARPK